MAEALTPEFLWGFWVWIFQMMGVGLDWVKFLGRQTYHSEVEYSEKQIRMEIDALGRQEIQNIMLNKTKKN